MVVWHVIDVGLSSLWNTLFSNGTDVVRFSVIIPGKNLLRQSPCKFRQAKNCNESLGCSPLQIEAALGAPAASDCATCRLLARPSFCCTEADSCRTMEILASYRPWELRLTAKLNRRHRFCQPRPEPMRPSWLVNRSVYDIGTRKGDGSPGLTDTISILLIRWLEVTGCNTRPFWNEEKWSRLPNGGPIASLRCPFERGDKWQSIHLKLTWAIGVRADGVDDSMGRPRPLRCVIEGQEDLEPGLGGRRVCLWYLSCCCLVGSSDVEGECVDAGGLR